MTVLQPRPTLGAPREWRFPAVRVQRLDSGLPVHACHLPGKALAAVSLLLDLPVTADPPGRDGLAVLAARSLDEGTVHRDAEAFADALERLGASYVAHADGTGLTVAVEAPAPRLRDALALLAESVTSPAFPVSEVERVRRQRVDQIRQEHADPGHRAALAFRAAVHDPSTRAARPDGGTAGTVAAVERDEIARLVGERFDPATSAVVVAGDLAGDDPVALVAEALGGWTSHGARRTPAVEPVPSRGPRVVVVDRPGSVQTQLVLGQLGPDRSSADWSALTVGAHVLGGTLTSRIDAVLREEKGYTYGMRAGFSASRRGGSFSVRGAVDAAATGPAVEDLLGVVRRTVEGGITAAERDAASLYLVGVSPLRWETPEAVASQVGALVGADLDAGWVDGFLHGMRSADVDTVSAALRRHLDVEAMVLVAVGAAEQVEPALRALGLAPVVETDRGGS